MALAPELPGLRGALGFTPRRRRVTPQIQAHQERMEAAVAQAAVAREETESPEPAFGLLHFSAGVLLDHHLVTPDGQVPRALGWEGSAERWPAIVDSGIEQGVVTALDRNRRARRAQWRPLAVTLERDGNPADRRDARTLQVLRETARHMMDGMADVPEGMRGPVIEAIRSLVAACHAPDALSTLFSVPGIAGSPALTADITRWLGRTAPPVYRSQSVAITSHFPDASIGRALSGAAATAERPLHGGLAETWEIEIHEIVAGGREEGAAPENAEADDAPQAGGPSRYYCVVARRAGEHAPETLIAAVPRVIDIEWQARAEQARELPYALDPDAPRAEIIKAWLQDCGFTLTAYYGCPAYVLTDDDGRKISVIGRSGQRIAGGPPVLVLIAPPGAPQQSITHGSIEDAIGWMADNLGLVAPERPQRPIAPLEEGVDLPEFDMAAVLAIPGLGDCPAWHREIGDVAQAVVAPSEQEFGEATGYAAIHRFDPEGGEAEVQEFAIDPAILQAGDPDAVTAAREEALRLACDWLDDRARPLLNPAEAVQDLDEDAEAPADDMPADDMPEVA